MPFRCTRVGFVTERGSQPGSSLQLVPGLADAHCHIGLDDHGAVDDEEAERLVDRRRVAGGEEDENLNDVKLSSRDAASG